MINSRNMQDFKEIQAFAADKDINIRFTDDPMTGNLQICIDKGHKRYVKTVDKMDLVTFTVKPLWIVEAIYEEFIKGEYLDEDNL